MNIIDGIQINTKMLTKEEIKDLNEEFFKEYGTYEQGIYVEPYGIPSHIKEPVIYMRWSPGGVSGGSCWDSSNPQPYRNDDKDRPGFLILDFVLKKLCPGISYLKYKELESIIESSEETEWEYYGNCTEWETKFVRMSKLSDFLRGI